MQNPGDIRVIFFNQVGGAREIQFVKGRRGGDLGQGPVPRVKPGCVRGHQNQQHSGGHPGGLPGKIRLLAA
ncbi:hypothetical protein SDC9_207120 [bioreactor metagenome]|uniref:Uncharacterized protein n=1 Tax=bioreactor metagenome TaxID=1076179 RepID=A0A645J9K1_9ZZZZ